MKPVRIVGGVGFVPAGKTEEEWRYLTEEGQMLTVSEVAGLSGGTVSEIRTGSTRKLVGSGVVWLPSEPLTDIASMSGGAEVLSKMGEQLTMNQAGGGCIGARHGHLLSRRLCRGPHFEVPDRSMGLRPLSRSWTEPGEKSRG